jgi:hypothetical protein
VTSSKSDFARGCSSAVVVLRIMMTGFVNNEIMSGFGGSRSIKS